MIFQDSLGIEISENKVVLVYLQKTFKGIKLVNHAIYSLEKGQQLNDKLYSARGIIEDFKRENKIGNTGLFIGIPDDLVIYKEIVFPLAVRENLRSTLGYEMEKHIPLALDDIYFDYQVVEENKGENRLKVLLIVAKKTSVEPYVNLAGSLSGDVTGIEAASISLSNFFSFINVKNINESPGFSPVFFHSNKQSFHEIFSKNDKEIFSKTGIHLPEIVPAFGLALKGLADVGFRINLLPQRYRKKPSRTRYYIMTGLIIICFLSALAWGGSRIIKQKLAIDKINTEMKRLVVEIKEIDSIQTRIDTIERRINDLNSLGKGYISLSDIMRELAQIIPETAWIRDFSLTDKGIALNGYAQSASELIGILESSPLFKDAVFMSTIVKEKDKERFSIGFKTEGVAE